MAGTEHANLAVFAWFTWSYRSRNATSKLETHSFQPLIMSIYADETQEIKGFFLQGSRFDICFEHGRNTRFWSWTGLPWGRHVVNKWGQTQVSISTMRLMTFLFLRNRCNHRRPTMQPHTTNLWETEKHTTIGIIMEMVPWSLGSGCGSLTWTDVQEIPCTKPSMRHPHLWVLLRLRFAIQWLYVFRTSKNPILRNKNTIDLYIPGFRSGIRL